MPELEQKDLEKIVVSVIADYIADQVVNRLTAERKKALLLFTGSLAGFGGVPEMLETLQSQGWDLKAVLSKGAEAVLPVEKLKEALPRDAVFSAADGRELRSLMDERPFLLLPALTVNTAAKIACCIADEPITNAVAYAIGRGKRILACVDGCCPDRKLLLPGGFHAPEAYKEQMRNNLAALKRFGIRLTDIRSLPGEAERQFIQFMGSDGGTVGSVGAAGTVGAVTAAARAGAANLISASAGGAGQVLAPAVGSTLASAVGSTLASTVGTNLIPAVRLDSAPAAAGQNRAVSLTGTDLRSVRVIGKGDVLSCRPGERLLVARDAVITQVAADEIERRSIELVKG